jgi:hypothetical protein
MSRNPVRQRLGSGLFLTCVLVAGLGLSACTQVDEMIDQPIDTPVTPASLAHTGARDEVKTESLRCDSITDERTWLDCYYGAAQPVRADLGLPPAPVSQQSLVPTSQ